MLYRKIQEKIVDWIRYGKKALLITGARQIGKTYIIKKMLEEEKCDFLYLNFIEEPTLLEILKSADKKSIDIFLERLRIISNKPLIKNKTIIVFDEVQEYKEIVSKIKFLVDESSYKYILSGSLLGVELSNLKSAPVGYLDILKMYPLDLEEFLIALNIKKETINYLKDCFLNVKEVDEFIHERIIDAFKAYLLVGGMPEAVNSYLETNDYNIVSEIQRNIIELYKMDFTKYEKIKNYKLIKTYDFIPFELAEKNKRYIIKDLDKSIKFDRYENSFIWLNDAGVAIPCYNITEPKLPLMINSKSSLFKLFLSDVGLLTAMYGKSTQLAIINDKNTLNCGAIYENFVCQELNSHSYKCYYYNSHKYGELDFVIESGDDCLPIEVRSGKDYKNHSAINNVLEIESYKINRAYVFNNSNVSRNGLVIYYPIYMLMFLNEDDKKIKLEKIDLSNL